MCVSPVALSSRICADFVSVISGNAINSNCVPIPSLECVQICHRLFCCCSQLLPQGDWDSLIFSFEFDPLAFLNERKCMWGCEHPLNGPSDWLTWAHPIPFLSFIFFAFCKTRLEYWCYVSFQTLLLFHLPKSLVHYVIFLLHWGTLGNPFWRRKCGTWTVMEKHPEEWARPPFLSDGTGWDGGEEGLEGPP